MLNCDNGTYDAWYWAHPPIYMPENCNLEDVAHIRQFVDIPVVCAGRMDPRVAADAVKEGKIDGAEFPEDLARYGKQTGTWEEAGSEEAFGASVKEIAAAVIGMKAGDKKEISVTFADDFAAEALRGKTAVYTLDVAEVRQRVLPELNEEFFKSVHVADEAEFKKQIREGLEANKKNAATAKTRENVINKLNELVDFELPQSAIDREAYNIFVEFANTQLRQGVKIEDIQAKRDELMENTKEAAKTRVKTQLILNAIAKVEDVKVEQADITARIQQEAYMSGMPAEKFVKELTKDRSRLMEMQANIRYNKALDVVVNAAVAK
jgi:trigger factor